MTCFFEFWERELLFVPNLSHETCLMCFFVVTVFYCFLQLLTLCINYNLCKPASHNLFFCMGSMQAIASSKYGLTWPIRTQDLLHLSHGCCQPYNNVS